MDSAEYSRKVAEAMGWRKCERPRPAWDEDIWHPAQDPTECSENCCPVPLLDLADARDREAVENWWLDKQPEGDYITTTKQRGKFTVALRLGNGIAITIKEAPTIEEAFGRAFLAAMGAGR